MTRIAAGVQLSSPSVTALINRLERGGLVRRGEHPGDRRKVLVELTDTSHRFAGLVAGPVNVGIRRCTAWLTDDEYRLALGFLPQPAAELALIPDPRAPRALLRWSASSPMIRRASASHSVVGSASGRDW